MQEYNVKVDGYGTIRWYQNGKLNRVDGPAVEYADGHDEWYLDGVRQYHHDEVLANIDASWGQIGKSHRENTPAIVIDQDDLT